MRQSSILKENKNEEVNKYNRPSWDEYFLEIMDVVGRRSTCDRGRTSCIIAKNKQILVTGYAGAPTGLPHCDEEGHLLKKTVHEDGTITEHCVRTVHAEQNAICQAAKLGVPIEGATAYVRMTPCRTCAMLLINCGIKRVYCERKYHAGAESEEMLSTAGIELVYKYDETQEYPKK
ncbi:MAG TPA: cytidine/deoxycytidylate deaminase family protein [Patescibacteria group bacterium]